MGVLARDGERRLKAGELMPVLLRPLRGGESATMPSSIVFSLISVVPESPPRKGLNKTA